MDMKLTVLILLNMAPPQKLVLAPGAIIRGNTVFHLRPKEPKQSSIVRRVLSSLFVDSPAGHSFKNKVKSYFILYNHQLSISNAVYTLTPSQEPSWELTQPWCEYPLKWAITSWWWDQRSLYIPHRAGTTPGNSPNLGVSILSIEPAPLGQHQSSVLPHRAETNFTPWCGETVTDRNIAQCFQPSLTFAGTGDRTWIACVAMLHANQL